MRLGQGPFIGRERSHAAREAAPEARRVACARSSSATDGYLPVYGGEAVRREGAVIGRLRSVAYGTTVSRTIGYVYLPGH